jgi:hypothetical protein
LSAANEAAKNFLDVEEDDVEQEDGWSSWEDLNGIRIQTDSEGKVRVIRMLDTQGEDLVWVEKKTVDGDDETEESESESESDGEDDEQGSKKLEVYISSRSSESALRANIS